MKGLIILSFLVLTTPFVAFSQDTLRHEYEFHLIDKNPTTYKSDIKPFDASSNTPLWKPASYKKLTGWGSAATVFSILPTSFLMIINHEVGHTVVAKIAGDNSAHFSLYNKNSNGGSCIGCNVYDHTKLSNTGNAFVVMGGVTFSQGLAKLSNLTLRKVHLSHGVQRLFAMTYMVSKLDFSFQVLQGVMKSSRFSMIQQYGHPSGTDMVDFGYYAGGGNRETFNWIQVGLVVVAILDIYLSRKVIKRNWSIVANRYYY